MANLIIQENGAARTAPAVHGEEITIQTPCDCTAVTGVQIAGVVYPFYDAAGNNLSSASGLFGEDSLIRVLIDTVNTRSYILNQAVSNANDDVAPKEHTHNVSDITGGTLPVARGGTGVTKNPSMLTDLGSNTADTVFEATPRPGVTGTLLVKNGGTGATTFTSGAALIGNGTGAVTTRAITNNTDTDDALTGSTNLVTMNTLRYAMNRTTGIESADTNYGTAMMRGIKAGTTDLTAGESELTSGMIYLVYEG